jgi:hypothetical protein
MSDKKAQAQAQVATPLMPKWVTVRPILNVLGIVSIVLLQEEGEHPYLSLALFGYCLEVHFKGFPRLPSFEEVVQAGVKKENQRKLAMIDKYIKERDEV